MTLDDETIKELKAQGRWIKCPTVSEQVLTRRPVKSSSVELGNWQRDAGSLSKPKTRTIIVARGGEQQHGRKFTKNRFEDVERNLRESIKAGVSR